MPNCSVFCCKKRSNTSSLEKDGVTFHMFPKDPNLRNTWKYFCNNKLTWIPTRNSVICSDHFKTSDFQELANNRRRLVEGAKPTLTPHCICASQSHQLSFTITDSLLSTCTTSSPQHSQSHQLSFTITDSLTSACTTSSPQHAQSKGTSKNYNSIPIALTPRERKMQQKLDDQKKKIKRLHSKNLYLKKKIAGLREILLSLDEKSFNDKKERMVIEKNRVEEI
ncbi:unnamed protein product [Parnassius mnemosyne]|uniref:THAP-type domain-containing protein n=1 Tax=Parnassius mnemosyne TaxID=213953 RepID=A0AAV1M3U3_9NEOP